MWGHPRGTSHRDAGSHTHTHTHCMHTHKYILLSTLTYMHAHIPSETLLKGATEIGKEQYKFKVVHKFPMQVISINLTSL